MSSYSSDIAPKLLKLLNHTSDMFIKPIINYYIKKSIKSSYDKNCETDTIGFDSDYNNVYPDITELDEIEGIIIPNNHLWYGFIPKNIKIVYSFMLSNYAASNNGYYYYLDNYSYLYEFAKYIKDKKVVGDYSFLFYVYRFINNYYSTLNEPLHRENMHHLIYNTDGIFYKPIKEHSITDFKGNGSAMCSEYSAMFQNILSVFGYESIYIHGEYGKSNSGICHAFNMIIIDDAYTLADLSIPIEYYDFCNSDKRKLPFLISMTDLTDEELDIFLSGESELELDDLEAYLINNEVYTFSKTNKRIYRADADINN